MGSIGKKWLAEFEWKGWNVSKSFKDNLNAQLQAAFKEITGIVFKGDSFHLHIEDSEIQINEEKGVPYSRLNGISS